MGAWSIHLLSVVNRKPDLLISFRTDAWVMSLSIHLRLPLNLHRFSCRALSGYEALIGHSPI